MQIAMPNLLDLRFGFVAHFSACQRRYISVDKKFSQYNKKVWIFLVGVALCVNAGRAWALWGVCLFCVFSSFSFSLFSFFPFFLFFRCGRAHKSNEKKGLVDGPTTPKYFKVQAEMMKVVEPVHEAFFALLLFLVSAHWQKRFRGQTQLSELFLGPQKRKKKNPKQENPQKTVVGKKGSWTEPIALEEWAKKGSWRSSDPLRTLKSCGKGGFVDRGSTWTGGPRTQSR